MTRSKTKIPLPLSAAPGEENPPPIKATHFSLPLTMTRPIIGELQGAPIYAWEDDNPKRNHLLVESVGPHKTGVNGLVTLRQ